MTVVRRNNVSVMKISIFVIMAIFVATVPVFGTEICVYRQEENGVINIREVLIMANGSRLLSVLGGEKKCVAVAGESFILYAQSSNPFDPADNNQQTWKSEPLSVSVSDDREVTVAVQAISRGATYTGPWQLKKVLPDPLTAPTKATP